MAIGVDDVEDGVDDDALGFCGGGDDGDDRDHDEAVHHGTGPSALGKAGLILRPSRLYCQPVEMA